MSGKPKVTEGGLDGAGTGVPTLDAMAAASVMDTGMGAAPITGCTSDVDWSADAT
jgi:hypothetical protein